MFANDIAVPMFTLQSEAIPMRTYSGRCEAVSKRIVCVTVAIIARNRTTSLFDFDFTIFSLTYVN